MRRNPQPTMVHLVFELLQSTDSMLATADVAAQTGVGRHDSFKTLHYLRSRHAVEWVRQGSVDYWFATPQSDDRVRHIAERTPELNGRRSRRIVITITTQPQPQDH